jgi:hypothetical protein
MPSFVPALYQLLSESSGWPTLVDTYLGNFSEYLDPSNDLAPIANEQRVFLVPVSLDDWLELGRVGTPILMPSEVNNFLEDVRREVRPGAWQPEGTSCWRFLPTNDGRSALFPDAGLYDPTFDIGISVKNSPASFQLGRLSMPWLRRERRRALGLPAGDESVSVSRDACSVVGLDQRQPGKKYSGRCDPVDCGGGCTDLEATDYTTGQTVLGGCKCKDQS